jgi:hypothetical protein
MISKKRNKMTLAEKLEEMVKIIKSIESDDPVVSAIMLEGFGFSLNLIAAKVENPNNDARDISEQLEIMSKILGISIKDVVEYIVQQNSGDVTSDKEADQATLEFITSDLDDYEKFLAQNKAKEDLDFLNKVI